MPTVRSPLRYPGGKTAISRYIVDLLKENNLLGCEYVEPFAGGAGVACELLLNDKVTKVVLNDYDRSVWAFWKCVLQRTEVLCTRIEQAIFTIKEWNRQRSIQGMSNPTVEELGFSTLYMNRVNYSGIIRGGVIGGKAQNGKNKMDCRFKKQQLIDKVLAIAERKRQIKLYSQDGLSFISKADNFAKNAFIYMDPPYYHAGNKLYMSDFDHEKHKRLASILPKMKQKWVMTYDCGLEINLIHSSRERMPFSLNYSANVKSKGMEMLIWDHRLRLPYRLS